GVLLGYALASPDGYRAGGSGRRGGVSCGEDQVPDVTGTCVDAEIAHNVYVFSGPPLTTGDQTPPELPKPKVEYNILYVHTPEQPAAPAPLLVGPPQQRFIVYVLSKIGEQQEPRIIEVPAGPSQDPEVIFVNYNDGDNPDLGRGLTLQDVLDSEAEQGGGVRTGGASGGGGGEGGGGSTGGGRYRYY
ncbi:UNVERIFIED_CONTAM: hypothetical protein GTU68_026327, partial [Idotea baltica]|nr:hypothetical protein [Idotea baltica]